MMNLRVLILMICLLLLPVPALSREKSVIIGFKQRPGSAERALVRRARGAIRRGYQLIPALAVRLPEDEIERLRENSEIAYVEEDAVYWAATDAGRAEESDNSWGARHVFAHTAHANGYRGAGVKVAILDSGIDYDHPDLSASYRGGYDFVFNDDDPFDDNYESHGTHVAGIIAAQDDGIGIMGVAPDVELFALKVLDGAGFGLGEWIIAGIDWAVANGMDIVNLSLEGRHTQALQEACDEAYSAGVLLVGAAGNSLAGGWPVAYPAAYDSVIAVTATDSADLPGDFSAMGQELELAAPGVDILSTVAGGDYGFLSGTSRAAPYVAGCAALYLLSNTEDLNADGLVNHEDLRLLLQVTATDLGEPGRDSIYGHGLVNAGGLSSPDMTLTLSRGTGLPESDGQVAVLEGKPYGIVVSNAGLSGVALDVFEGEVWREDLSAKFRFFGERADEALFWLDASDVHYHVFFTPYGTPDTWAEIVIKAHIAPGSGADDVLSYYPETDTQRGTE